MANFVVESHIRHHPNNDMEEVERQAMEADSVSDLNENTRGIEKIPQELFKKYIIYSKEKVHPKLHNMDQVSNFLFSLTWRQTQGEKVAIQTRQTDRWTDRGTLTQNTME